MICVTVVMPCHITLFLLKIKDKEKKRKEIEKVKNRKDF